MELNTLHTQLKKGCCDSNLYIFTGDEIEVQNIYIEQIKKCSGLMSVRLENVADFVHSVHSSSIFGELKCYIIRDDMDFLKADKYWRSVFDMVGSNILILLYTQLDSRLSFTKRFSDRIINFPKLQKSSLKKYLSKSINLPDKYLDYLIDICDYDLARCQLEVDKINRYINCTNLSVVDTMRKLIQDGTIKLTNVADNFDFVNAALSKDLESVWEMAAGISSDRVLYILSLLYSQFKMLLQVQTVNNVADISKVTGIDKWKANNLKQFKNIRTDAELFDILFNLHSVEKSIKEGEYKPQIELIVFTLI